MLTTGPKNLCLAFLFAKYLDLKLLCKKINHKHLFVKILDIKTVFFYNLLMQRDHVDFIIDQWKKEKPDIDGSPMGVIGRISRLARHFDQLLQKKFAEFGVTAGDFDVLATLRRSGQPYQLTPTQLYHSVMLTSGGMTARLNRMEREGLIERRPNPDDRRGVFVSLTPRGLALIDELFVEHIANEAGLISAISEAEQAKLAALLRELLLSFENRYLIRKSTPG